MNVNALNFVRNCLVAPVAFVVSKGSAAIRSIAASAFNLLTVCYSYGVSLKNWIVTDQTKNPSADAAKVQAATQLSFVDVSVKMTFDEMESDLQAIYRANINKIEAAGRNDLVQVFRSTFQKGLALMNESDADLTFDIYNFTKSQLLQIAGFLENKGTVEEESLLTAVRFKEQFEQFAAKDASVEEFMLLFETHQTILHSELTYDGGSILHHIAQNGKGVQAIPLLAQFELDFNRTDRTLNNTPLIWAIANAHNTAAFELIPYTNVNLKGCNNTALVLAAAKGYTDRSAQGQYLTISNFELMQNLVLHGADVNLAGAKGLTPLHIAYLRRDEAMKKFLIEAGARKDVLNAAKEKPEDMAKKSYQEAFAILGEVAQIFILDKARFPEST